MAQAPAHIRLEDAERLMPKCLVSLSAKVRHLRGKAPVAYPIRLSLAQAEEIVFAYKDLRERLGVCKNEIAYLEMKGPRPKYGHTFVRKKKGKLVSLERLKVESKWKHVLEGLK